MTIKVYGGVLSGRTARVLVVLFEKDVTDFELVPVRIDTSPEEVPEFLKTQPFGQTPVLVDGPLILFVSSDCPLHCGEVRGSRHCAVWNDADREGSRGAVVGIRRPQVQSSHRGDLEREPAEGGEGQLS